MFSSLLDAKASVPIVKLLISLGINNLVRFLQFVKARLPIVIIDVGKVISSKPLQFEKALL